MKQSTFTGSEQKKLAYRLWEAEGRKRGTVVIVHGYTEHGGRYAHFAEQLIQNGMSVYAHDHIGHGLSEGVRAHVKKFDTLVEDLHLFMEIVLEDAGSLPVYLFGQSMGGAVALLFTARYGKMLSGCILSAPAFVIGLKIPPVLKAVSRVLSVLFPKMKVNRGIAEHLSRDPAVIAAYNEDRFLKKKKNRARLGYLLLQLEETIPPELSGITLPICIMQGTADKVVDPKGARIIYENISSDDKTLKWFRALYHELLHEPEKDEVISFALSWLEKQLLSPHGRHLER